MSTAPLPLFLKDRSYLLSYYFRTCCIADGESALFGLPIQMLPSAATSRAPLPLPECALCSAIVVCAMCPPFAVFLSVFVGSPPTPFIGRRAVVEASCIVLPLMPNAGVVPRDVLTRDGETGGWTGTPVNCSIEAGESIFLFSRFR